MLVQDLQKIIDQAGDDFRIQVRIVEGIPAEQLAAAPHWLPFESAEADIELDDIGYSDKVVCFSVTKKVNSVVKGVRT